VILLDTCAIIWDALEPQKLSSVAAKAIAVADRQERLLVSDISWWEIAMLVQKGRLQLDSTAANFMTLFLQSRRVSVIPISPAIAELSAGFGATLNPDPADRIIAATAILHRAQIVTADKNLLSATVVDTLW
jgi:PIN domain nuclease of toxin-antitoxin system